jgi:hypothetical protein
LRILAALDTINVYARNETLRIVMAQLAANGTEFSHEGHRLYEAIVREAGASGQPSFVLELLLTELAQGLEGVGFGGGFVIAQAGDAREAECET